ncbi:MAG: SGNH/GDSL hydrolase family protein [Elusimicrobia bacterium]|nr:SGNH/GDSL hydrolase family protein [Elusimicrobiota bacterium]
MVKKALLSLTSLGLFFSVLEFSARRVVASRGPVLLRDGIYVNTLPLVTGVAPPSMRPLLDGARLPERKPPGEARIFVFGESSVEGAPLDVNASPPTMLYDRLARAYPNRAIKVINMGMTASICANTYYQLLYARRYEPDVLIFYMGMNDGGGHMPGEQSWPVTRPLFHRFWRGLMERSQLFWCAKVYGPPFLWSLRSRSPNRDLTQERGTGDPFPEWADLLVRIAASTGAKVIVTTPVRSAVSEIEPAIHSVAAAPDDSVPMRDDYRRLLACRLTDACDFIALFKEQATGGEDPPLDRHLRKADAKAEAWKSAADRYGAELIDFHSALEDLSPHRVVADRYFADEIHLTPEGYGFLARLWFEHISGSWDGRKPRAPSPPVYDDVKEYYKAAKNNGMAVFMMYLARGWYLTAVPGLEMVAQHCPGGERDGLADVSLGWLRQRAGLPAGGSREFAKKVKAFNPKREFAGKVKGFRSLAR